MSKYSQYFDHTFDVEAEAIRSLKQVCDYEVMEQIVALLLTVKQNKQKVITVGCGTSGTAARRVAHTLCCIEVPAYFLSPADAPHGAMGGIQQGDIVVLFTKGGNTPEILNYIPCCKDKGAVIIGVTENRDSALARACDILLYVSTGEEPCPWGIMPCSSTLGAVAVWDAITLTAMRFNGYTKEEFLRIHPSGRTAERLSAMIEGNS